MEQIKAAIAKAKAERDATPPPDGARPVAEPAEAAAPAPQPEVVETPAAGSQIVEVEDAVVAGPDDVSSAWSALEMLEPNKRRLKRNRVVTFDNANRAHVSFDVMRTRLRKIVAETGWRRIGVTSPLPKCGKSTISANLAFAMARHEQANVLLYDFDFKSPHLASIFGKVGQRPIKNWLAGYASFQDHFVKYSERFGVCFNTEPVRHAAELVESPTASDALAEVERRLRPTAEIFDIGPLLSTDDPLAILSMLDCVILVGAAGQTKPEDLIEAERLIGGHTNYVGALLNKVTILPRERGKYY